MVASYERLADFAFAAAMDIQRHISGKASSFQAYRDLVRLLEEPLVQNGSYKLLYDVRNVPLYRAAWSSVVGPVADDLKTEVLLKRVSEFLQSTLDNIDSRKPFKAPEMARFCLALNELFLEENAKQYSANYRLRMRNAAP